MIDTKNRIVFKGIIIESDLNFLIVDDQQEILEFIESYLKMIGFNGSCFLAQNIYEAKKLLSENKIDYLITDKILPDGNGDSLLKAIRKSKKFYDIPVLIISGNDDIENIVTSSKLGSSDYLVKPFDYEMFKEKLINSFKMHMIPKQEEIHALKSKIIDLEQEIEDLKEKNKVQIGIMGFAK